MGLAHLHAPHGHEDNQATASVGAALRTAARELLTVLLRFADTSENDQRSRLRFGLAAHHRGDWTRPRSPPPGGTPTIQSRYADRW